MKRLLLIAITLFTCNLGFSQISHGGRPVNWEGKSIADVSFERIHVPDRAQLAAEDAVTDQYKDIPYRFGIENAVDFDSQNYGTWTELENGTRVWRLGISAPEALTINFSFDVFDIPEGAQVFVYDPGYRQIIGSFTSENTNKNGGLGVGLVPSDQIIIEYIEPAGLSHEGNLHIDNVVYGYRSILEGLGLEEKAGPFGNSGACNIDVNCADLDLYDFPKRSVAIIVNGGGICSGALINNTSQDLHPYFLTANHCLPGNINNVDDWVFYFNHEIPVCGGSPDEAPTNQSVSGSSVVAHFQESDFALLEFDNNVPASYNVCFSGWDATDSENLVNSAYAIHHPHGDVKKICFENDAPHHDLGTAGFVNQTWFIDQWEEGVTEPGSSGSPLFNQNGQIIGQLSGGAAACQGEVNNGEFDYFGRFGISWNFGSTPETRLSDWLDPTGTGQLIMPSSCANVPENDLTLATFGIDEPLFCSLEPFNQTITVVNTGSNDITSFVIALTINGESQDNINWSGTLESFQNISIDLGEIQSEEGDNTLEVQVLSVNGGDDSNENGNFLSDEFVATDSPLIISFTLQLDEYPTETSWRIVDDNNITYYSGGGYEVENGLVEQEFCMPEGCYSFIIEDFWGDGICCSNGDGFYLLQDGNGATLAEGGDFGSEEIMPFCAEPLGVSENKVLNSISVFPNPAKDFIQINLGDVQQVNQIIVTDLLGKTVQNLRGNSIQGKIIRLETSNFNSGLYLIQINTEAGTATRKIVIE